MLFLSVCLWCPLVGREVYREKKNASYAVFIVVWMRTQTGKCTNAIYGRLRDQTVWIKSHTHTYSARKKREAAWRWRSPRARPKDRYQRIAQFQMHSALVSHSLCVWNHYKSRWVGNECATGKIYTFVWQCVFYIYIENTIDIRKSSIRRTMSRMSLKTRNFFFLLFVCVCMVSKCVVPIDSFAVALDTHFITAVFHWLFPFPYAV